MMNFEENFMTTPTMDGDDHVEVLIMPKTVCKRPIPGYYQKGSWPLKPALSEEVRRDTETSGGGASDRVEKAPDVQAPTCAPSRRTQWQIIVGDDGRRFIVDTGASFHLGDYRQLTKRERKTIRKLVAPITVTTADGMLKLLSKLMFLSRISVSPLLSSLPTILISCSRLAN